MSEHAEQCVVIDWASRAVNYYPELEWLFAVPNGAKLPWTRNKKSGNRWSPEAQWQKAEGLKPGVSDLCLPYPKGIYHSLYIEMKFGSNKPTEPQQQFIEAMNKAGNLALVCYGAEEAINALEHYLRLKDGEEF